MLVDGAWKLEIAEMPAIELDVPGVRDSVSDCTNFGRPDDRILRSGDHQRRYVDGAEQLRVVRPGRDRSLRECDSGGRAATDASAHRVHDVRLRLSVRAQQTTNHQLDDWFDRLLAFDEIRHGKSVLARSGSVGCGARVAQRESANPLWREPPQREGEIAAHRKSHDGEASDITRIECFEHGCGERVEAGIAGRRWRRRAATPQINTHAAHVTR